MKTRFLSFMVIGLALNSVNAEIVVDNSLPGVVSGEIEAVDNQYSITAANGELRGGNLFFSFNQFNVEVERTANFSGPSTVSNIISRVTGGEISTINGTISSDIAGVNLWLINPNGVLFGENAKVDIPGSFHVATADSILLRDGTPYYADVIDQNGEFISPILTASSPHAFGFLSAVSLSAKIEIDNAQIMVGENESISLIANDISIKGSLLSAPGGNISLVTINESGEVIYSDQGLDVGSIDNFGSLSLDTTQLNIDGVRQKGQIQILADNLELNSRNTDFVSSVSNLQTNFAEDSGVMEKPCELADFYTQGKMRFTVSDDGAETEYGLKTKKKQQGPIGGIDSIECL